jgi:hypothetical protein
MDSLCDGLVMPLLPHLVHSKGLTQEQRRMLLALIQQGEEQSQPEKGKTRRKPGDGE